VGSNPTSSATCAVAPDSFVTASVTVGPRSGGRRRQLDGLRAIAFFAVFYNHAGGHIIWGQLGVRCFFALSGFLICGLLLDDDRPAGAVLRTFYWRRSLRIFPLYYLALGLIWSAHGLPSPWWHLAYGSNIAQYISRETNNVAHFWTLAIEEQFYAVFPLLLMAGRRRPGMTIAGALVASKAARVVLAIGDQSNWMDLLPHIGGETLLWGALAAVVLRRFPDLAAKRWWWLVFGGASLVTIWSLVRGIDFMELPIWSRSLDATPDGIGWASLAIGLWCAQTSSSCARLLSWKPLSAAGAISYGLYVFHVPVIHGDLGNAWLLQALIAPDLSWAATVWLFALPFTFAMALLSWHLLEAPVLRWREREPREVQHSSEVHWGQRA